MGKAPGAEGVEPERDGEGHGREARAARPLRADAKRNTGALLDAALAVFVESGVDAPVREIAEKAGVGIGTFYRHFPQRSDLIIAVFRHQVDACAEAAVVLSKKYAPGEALARWIQRYADFIGTKRGLAAALHSGDPAYDGLPAYFKERLQPALQTLLDAAARAGEARAGIAPYELLAAVASLCMQTHGQELAAARRMVALLIDGLRHGAR